MLFPTMNAGVHAVPVQHPVRRERLPPIPVQQVLTTNADRPVKTVLRLVHPDILRLIPADVMIQRPMNAVIPAINRKPVAPIPVPVVQNTTQVLMPQLPNVVQPAITVQTVAQAVLLLIPDPMPQPRNAVQPVTLVQTLVQADLLLPLVLRVIHQLSSVIQNAEALVIPVRPMPAADTALPAARVTVPAVPACPARQLSTSLTLVTPGTQCRVPVASRMILVIIILQKHAPTDVRHTIPTVRQSARPVTPITATTEPRSSLPVRQMRPAPTSPTAPPQSKVGPATPDIRSREVPV